MHQKIEFSISSENAVCMSFTYIGITRYDSVRKKNELKLKMHINVCM